MELYVREPGSSLTKEGERVIIRREGTTVAELPFAAVEHVRLVGSGVHVSTPLLHALLDAAIPVSFLSTHGHYRGQLVAGGEGGASLRQAQYAATLQPTRCLPIAQAIVAGKLRNQRFLLRRHGERQRAAMLPLRTTLAAAISRARAARSVDALRGIEGTGARIYFSGLGLLLPPCAAFTMRSRRPPRDLGNALLGYGYAALLAECVLAIRVIGLDPALGCLHQPHHDQPALALDLMEEFRPLIVDAAVLDLTCRHRITEEDGMAQDGGVRLSVRARGLLITAIEERLATRRMGEWSTEPLALRDLVRRQGRLLRDALLGRAVYAPLPLP